MLPYAKAVASLQFEYETAAFNYRETGVERLRLASIPVIAHYNITDLLVRFQLEFPNVQVDVQEADTLEVREWLLQRKCDLAFFRDSSDIPFVAVPVAPEISTTLYLAYLKGTPLSTAASHFVSYCQLKGRPGIDSK